LRDTDVFVAFRGRAILLKAAPDFWISTDGSVCIMRRCLAPRYWERYGQSALACIPIVESDAGGPATERRWPTHLFFDFLCSYCAGAALSPSRMSRISDARQPRSSWLLPPRSLSSAILTVVSTSEESASRSESSGQGKNRVRSAENQYQADRGERRMKLPFHPLSSASETTSAPDEPDGSGQLPKRRHPPANDPVNELRKSTSAPWISVPPLL
jgi:hypothetical protein